MTEKAETIQEQKRIGKPTLYLVTAALVFLTIYSLGQRIDILTTAFSIVGDWSPLFYWYAIMVISCGLLGLWMIWLSRKSLLRADTLLMAGFLIWMMVSVVMNRGYGFSENLKVTVSFGVMIVLGYLVGRTFDRESMNFLLRRVILWGSVIWNIGCVISMAMYFVNYKGYYKFGAFVRRSRQGIMEGRLFGDFSDPNYAAIISLILIAGLWYLYRTMVPPSVKIRFAKLARIYLAFCMILYALYIVMSGSRSSQVAMIVMSVVLSVLVIYRKRKYQTVCEADENTDSSEDDRKPSAVCRFLEKAAPINGNPIRTYGVRIFLLLVTLVFVYFGVTFITQGIGAISAPDRDTETELEREDVSLENISNNRFDIWLEYISTVKDSPLWGYSTNGALQHLREVDPEAYIAKYSYNPHSMFVQELVQTGVVGFLLIMAFFIRLFIRTWKRCIREKPLPKLFLLALAWVLLHGVFCFFNVGFFVSPRFEDMLAWIGLGLLEQGSAEDRSIVKKG